MSILIDFFLIILIIFILLFGVTLLIGFFSAGPFVPSSSRWLERFSEIVDFKKGQKFYDLGCGDGRLLRFVERKFGIKGVGYEIAPLVYIWARIANFLAGSRTKVKFQSLFSADLRDADVIFLYLVPFILKKLAKKLKNECKKSTVVVSQSFKIPGLTLYREIPRDNLRGFPSFYIYIISK